MNAEPALVERTKLSLKPRRNCTAGETSEPKVVVAIMHLRLKGAVGAVKLADAVSPATFVVAVTV
jgi:hypothetical protein